MAWFEILRHLDDARNVVALRAGGFKRCGVVFFRHHRFAAHDPDQAAVGIADRRVAVIRREVDNEEWGFEWPKKLHGPLGVGFGIHHSGGGLHLLAGCFEGFFVECVADVDFSVGPKFVDIHRAHIVFFDEPRDGADHIPVAHEPVEIHMIHGAERCLFWQGSAARECDGGDGKECFHLGFLQNDLRSSQNQIPI